MKLSPAASIAAAVVLLAAGCGQKGPLYLPDKGAVVVKPPPAATSPAKPKPDDKDPDQSSPPKP
ncbi:MAG TPA: lipoprotein [Steroidobacteraceae bacterium]|nr:lipoprotein [Steroidobacteraceae bacterium]